MPAGGRANRSVCAVFSLIEHTVATMVGQRIYGIALGYEDRPDVAASGASLPTAPLAPARTPAENPGFST